MKPNAIKGWARSTNGHPIDLYFSPTYDWTKLQNPLLFIGGMHGDEPEGVALAEATLQWLKNYNYNLPLAPWILIPCLNFDGYQNRTRVNARGVDLNRNFPAKNWTSEYKEERYFPGPHPNSEPETKALSTLILEFKPRLVVHFHSWKPCIVCTGHKGRKDAQYLAEASGFEIVEEIGYPTPGSLSSFAWHDHGLPVICTEDEEHRDPNRVWPRFGEGIKKIFFDQSQRQ